MPSFFYDSEGSLVRNRGESRCEGELSSEVSINTLILESCLNPLAKLCPRDLSGSVGLFGCEKRDFWLLVRFLLVNALSLPRLTSLG